MLGSVTKFAPDIPLFVIPFGGPMRKMLKLRRRFPFEVFDHDLERYDEMGRPFFRAPRWHRLFRKLAAFEVPADGFLYCDIDCILLISPAWLNKLRKASKLEFVAAEPGLDAVYTDRHLRDRMVSNYRSSGFNTGLFLSHQGAIGRRDFERLALMALPDREGMASYGEQPYLNYLVDTSGIPRGLFRDLDPSLSNLTWARRQIYERGGALVDEQGGRLVALHWAGEWLGPRMPNYQQFKDAWLQEPGHGRVRARRHLALSAGVLRGGMHHAMHRINETRRRASASFLHKLHYPRS
jgi:hypothetical protein